MTSTTHPPRTQTTSKRIDGLDIARAFAIVGMVIVNYKTAMSAESTGAPALKLFAALFDGRAAATFVVLAGIGASLGSRRARSGEDASDRRAARITLAKRALFLFVIGWLFYPIWPADILHYYGVYLAIGAAVLFISNRQLLWLAAGSIVVAALFIITFDSFANWDLDDLSYDGIATPSGFLRNLFLDGFHPVFPWIAFYLFGMWLGRTDLRDPQWRRTLVIRSVIAVAIAETAAWTLLGPKGSSLDEVDDESWRWLFTVAPIPPLPLYLIAGAGTAVLVIVGSIWLGNNLTDKVKQPLAATGQLALTLYLAHVLVGLVALDLIGRLEDQTIEWALLTSAVFSAGAIAFSWWWRRNHDRGPVEWLMRRIAG